MATMQEYIERLIYQYTSTGADKVADDMNKVGAAQTTTSTSALNLEKSFNSLERRFDSTIRAAQDYAAVQAKVAAAVAQNPALQERANNILTLAAQKFQAAGQAQGAFAEITERAGAVVAGYASQAGLLGAVLQRIGPIGLGAAAAVGAGVTAYAKATEMAAEFSKEMAGVANASKNIGLTTSQFQALGERAASVGVNEEKMTTGFQRFASQMDEVRQRSGPLYSIMSRIDDDLAQQAVRARSTGEAWNALVAIYNKAGASAAALERTAVGRGSAGLLRSGTTGEALAHAEDVVPQETIDRIQKLEAQIAQTAKAARNNIASIFSEDILKGQLQWNERWLEFSRIVKDFSLSPSLQKLMTSLGKLDEFTAMLGGGHGEGAPSADTPKKPVVSLEEQAGVKEGMFDNVSTQLIKAGEDIARKFNTAGQTIRDLKHDIEDMVSALEAGGSAGLLRPAIDAARVLLKTMQDTADATARHNSEMLKLADKYQGISLDTAQILEKQKGQLAVAEAQTGKARMAAQEQATINDLLLQGKTLAEATAIAAGQRAITQAQLNTGARQQLAALQEQYGVAAAVTGLQKIQAQEAATVAALIRQGVDAQYAMAVGAQQTVNALAQVNASAQATLQTLQDQHAVASASTADERLAAQETATRNNLLRQGVSEELAAAVAAQERANAEAQINVAFEKQLATAQAITGLQKIMLMDWREQAVAIAEANSNLERQTHSLQQQNELTIARMNGNEANVAAQQAYNNALDSGADKAHALANADQVRLKYQIQINEKIFQEQQARQAAAAAEQEQLNLDLERKDAAIFAAGSAGAKSAADSMSQVLLQLNDLGDHTYDYFRNIAIGAMSVQQALTMAGALQNQLTKVQAQQKAEATQKQQAEEQKQKAEAARQKYQGFEDQIQQLQNQRALAEARKISPEAEAQVQSQQASAKAIAEGATAAQAQQIADLTLANALAENTSAVQSNTEALSPYYASDPRLSHLGFRAGSSALDYDPFAQPATGAAGPAALPFGSTAPGGLPSVPSPSIAPAGNEQIIVTPRGNVTAEHWLQMSAGLTGSSSGQSRTGAPYLVARNGMQMDARDLTQGAGGGRPIQIVQNFNAPVDRSVAAEMKISAYQAAQSGMRSLRAVR